MLRRVVYSTAFNESTSEWTNTTSSTNETAT